MIHDRHTRSLTGRHHALVLRDTLTVGFAALSDTSATPVEVQIIGVQQLLLDHFGGPFVALGGRDVEQVHGVDLLDCAAG